jgi:hypothetical protein
VAGGEKSTSPVSRIALLDATTTKHGRAAGDRTDVAVAERLALLGPSDVKREPESPSKSLRASPPAVKGRLVLGRRRREDPGRTR